MNDDIRLESLAFRGLKDATWYDDTAIEVRRLGDALGVSAERVAFSIAALSPRVAVSRNVALFGLLATGKPAEGLKAPWRKAEAIFHNGDHIDTMRRAAYSLKGRAFKTSSFACNLLGELGPVTLDVWMARALGVRQEFFNTVTGYRLASQVVSRVGEKMWLRPAECQAAIWHGIVSESFVNADLRARDMGACLAQLRSKLES